jgi:hypothetical protein
MENTDDLYDKYLLTRFTIRVTGRKPWNVAARWAAMAKFHRLLNKLLQDNMLDLTDWPDKGQAILTLAVHCADPQTPTDGRKASEQGFLREENPFQPGTKKYAAWDKSWEDGGWDVRP